MPNRSSGIALARDSVEALNSPFEGGGLVTCVVDPGSRLAVITLNVFWILPEDGTLEDWDIIDPPAGMRFT